MEAAPVSRLLATFTAVQYCIHFVSISPIAFPLRWRQAKGAFRRAVSLGEGDRRAWLSLEEAAHRLGVSRLRLREGIAAGAVRAQRDNRGLWRVTLDDIPDWLIRRTASVKIEP